MTASEDAKMKSENSPESPNKESRKSAKPIMEKRRRARINASLSELKALLLEVLKKEGSRHSKMEKADILEMTVKHLKNIQRQQFSVAVSSDPSTLNKYHAGFSECATEVSRYLSTIDGVDVELRTRLLNHLARRVQNTPPNSQGLPVSSAPTCLPVSIQTSYQLNNVELNSSVATYPQGHVVNQIRQHQPIVVNSDQAKIFSGIQIVPARLPTGELSFVVPGNVLGGNQTPSYVIPIYASPAVGSPSAPSNCSVTTATTLQSVPRTSPIQQSAVTPPRPAPPTENVLNISAPFLMMPSNVSPQQMFGASPPPLLERKQVWRPW